MLVLGYPGIPGTYYAAYDFICSVPVRTHRVHTHIATVQGWRTICFKRRGRYFYTRVPSILYTRNSYVRSRSPTVWPIMAGAFCFKFRRCPSVFFFHRGMRFVDFQVLCQSWQAVLFAVLRSTGVNRNTAVCRVSNDKSIVPETSEEYQYSFRTASLALLSTSSEKRCYNIYTLSYLNHE